MPSKSHPGLFKDMTKRCSDLLTKEFPSEKGENKIEWKGEADYNVTLQTSLVSKRDGSIVGTFTPKYTHKDWDTTFLAELSTNRDVKAEISTEELLGMDGLKTTITANSKGKDRFVEVGLEFKHEMATVTGSIDYGKASGSTVKASAVIGSQGLALGASTEYHLGGESELKELKTILSYSKPDFDIAATGVMKQNQGKDADKNEFSFNYFHKINADWVVGAETTFDTSNADAKPSLVFATQYRLEPDTVLKGKLGTNGQLGFSYSQKYNKFARLNISSTVDTNNLSAKNASSFGFTLSLND